MPRRLADGEVPNEQEKKGKQLIVRAGILFLVLFVGFFAIWMMGKLNYKLLSLRQQFFPVLGGILVFLFFIFLGFRLFSWLLNISSRSKYTSIEQEDDEEQAALKKVKSKK